MHDTAERIRRVKLRAAELRRRGETQLLSGLSAACVVLALSLVRVALAIAGSRRGGAVPGLYGAMLLDDGAGGYVLAGVLAFMAGVVVTVLCLKHRKKAQIQTGACDKEEKRK